MKWNKKTSSIFMAMLFLSMIFVSLPQAQEKSGEKIGQPTQSNPVEKKIIPFSTPLASYKDKEFSVGYFMTYMGDALQKWPKIEAENKEKVLRDLLKQMFFEHLVYDMAIKDGQDKDPEYIIGNRELEQNWLGYYVTQNLFTKKLNITDDEIKERYEKEKEKYYRQAEFSFWHIFTQTVDKNDEQKKQARVNAEAALALIKAGSDFEEVAKTYSESLNKGQLMGPFKTRKDDPENAINETLEKKLLTLKNGEVSEIVETKYGFEILKLKEYAPSHYSPLEEVKETLRRSISREKEIAWKESFVNDHWKDAVTVFAPDLLADEKSAPDSVIIEIYGQKITKSDIARYKKINTKPGPEEKADEFKSRLEKDLKSSVIFGYIAAKTGRDAKYDTIPRYINETHKVSIQKAANFWWRKYLDRNITVKDVTEEEKKAAYDQYPDYFLKPSMVHAAEMTFTIPEVKSDSKFEVFKAQNLILDKAKKALARVKNGEKFEDVAKEVSDSTVTAAKGGDLGLISNKSTVLPSSIVSSLYRMKDNEISEEPVKEGNVYYIVKCIEKPKPDKMAYDDAETQDRLQKVVRYLRSKDFYKTFSENLLKPEDIKILYPEFTKIDLSQIEMASNEIPQ